MALVACPQCGHKVMNVASTCPHCSFSLVEQRTLEAHRQSGSRCASCGEVIPSGATACPHCRSSRPTKLNLMWAIPAAILVVAAVAVVMTFGKSSPDAGPAADAAPEEQPATNTAASVDSPAEVAPPAAPPVSVQMATRPTDPPQTITRWTANWVNVREDRRPEAARIMILEPGQEVEVADLQYGWWAVYLDGEFIGYVARSLIVDEPPEEPTRR